MKKEDTIMVARIERGVTLLERATSRCSTRAKMEIIGGMGPVSIRISLINENVVVTRTVPLSSLDASGFDPLNIEINRAIDSMQDRMAKALRAAC